MCKLATARHWDNRHRPWTQRRRGDFRLENAMKLRGFVSTVLLLSLCWVAALNAYAQTAGSAVGAPADVTDAKAQFELAQKYDRGVGQPRDPGQASAWARKAADQGYAPAQFMLGMMYKRGDGVAQDVPEALRLLRLAAEQGDRFGQYQWGLENWTGANMPRNDRQAARWFELAGQQGIAEGMINLGLQFWNGKGVVRNAGVAWALSNLASTTSSSSERGWCDICRRGYPGSSPPSSRAPSTATAPSRTTTRCSGSWHCPSSAYVASRRRASSPSPNSRWPCQGACRCSRWVNGWPSRRRRSWTLRPAT